MLKNHGPVISTSSHFLVASIIFFAACIYSGSRGFGQTTGALSPKTPLISDGSSDEYYSSVEISPNGDYACGITEGAYSNSRISVWRVGDREEVYSQETEHGPFVAAWAVRSAKSQNLLAVLRLDASRMDQPQRDVIDVIEFPSASVVKTVELPDQTYSDKLILSEDGQYVALGDNREKSAVRVFDSNTGKQLCAIRLHFRSLNAFTFVPGMPLIALGGLLNSGETQPPLIIHDYMSNKPYAVSRWQKDSINCLSVSSDGKRLASQGQDSGNNPGLKVLGIQPGTLKVLGTYSNEAHDYRPRMRFTTDDSQLWFMGERYFRLWDSDSGKEIHTQMLISNPGSSDVTPSSNALVFTHRQIQKEPLLLESAPILRFAEPTFVKRIFDEEYSNEIRGMTLSRDGRTLALAKSYDGIAVVDLETMRRSAWIPYEASEPDIEQRSVVISPDMTMYYQNEYEEVLYRRELPNGKPVAVLRLPEDKHISSVAVSPSGSYIATRIYDQKTLILDQTGKVVHQHEYPGEIGAISDDGKWLAMLNRGLEIINVDSKTSIGTWDADHPAGWGFGGSELIGRGDGDDGLWKLSQESGELRRDFPLHRSVGSRAMSIAASAPYFVVADETHIRIYNSQTNRMLGVLRGQTASILSIAISQDGRTVYSGDEKGNLLKWDLTRWVEEDAKGAERNSTTSPSLNVAQWPSGPQVFESKSGVRITIEALDGTPVSVVDHALRDVLRNIQSSSVEQPPGKTPASASE